MLGLAWFVTVTGLVYQIYQQQLIKHQCLYIRQHHIAVAQNVVVGGCTIRRYSNKYRRRKEIAEVRHEVALASSETE